MADGLWPVWLEAVWLQHLFLYCERGLSSTLSAEPVNAVSNLAFVAVGLWWFRQPRPPAIRFLASLAALVGVGSMLFHTFAQRWAQVADAVPIVAFIAAAAVVVAIPVLHATRRECAVVAVVCALAALMLWIYGVANGCRLSPASLDDLATQPQTCLNGGLAYVFPGLVLGAATVIFVSRGVAGGGYFAAATLVFAVALFARSIDLAVCPLTNYGVVRLTGHAFWHLGTASVAHLIIAGIAAALTSSAIQTRP
jgi:Ceramidase